MAFARKDEEMLENSQVQPVAPQASGPFHKGDQVYLAKGSYEGTIGTFLNLRSDPKWADICETDESIREHPVEWIARSVPPNPQK